MTSNRDMIDARAQAFLKKIAATYGQGTVFPMSKMSRIKRIPTGIADLDINLGGGIAAGRINIIWGPRSSGKTSLCGDIVTQAGMLNRHDLLPLGDPALPGTSDIPIDYKYCDREGVYVLGNGD